jgi:hypothetical protein
VLLLTPLLHKEINLKDLSTDGIFSNLKKDMDFIPFNKINQIYWLSSPTPHLANKAAC